MAKSHVDITQCQHGKVLFYISLCYIIKKIKNIFPWKLGKLETRGNWENSKLRENTPPSGRRVSTQFLVFPIYTRVDITVYINTENVLYLLNIKHLILYTSTDSVRNKLLVALGQIFRRGHKFRLTAETLFPRQMVYSNQRCFRSKRLRKQNMLTIWELFSFFINIIYFHF